LEETTADPTGWTRIQYTLGDDVISQTTSTYSGSWSAGTTQYLLYDGHGSTRQLAYGTSGSVSIQQSYNYDAYGTLLQDASAQSDPGITSPQATSLLYAGEQFDTEAQQYYLRARYYNPLNGTFNRVDPYAGNTQDPQSLHKYTYCHNNPVNAIDPTGMMEFSLGGLLMTAVITGLISSIIAGEVVRIKGGTTQQIIDAQVRWLWIGFIVAAAVYSVAWTIHALWL
jgi:RHS repeat-associated protein